MIMKARSRSRPGRKARPVAHRLAAQKNEIQTCAFQARVSWRIVRTCMVFLDEIVLKNAAIFASRCTTRHRSDERGETGPPRYRAALPCGDTAAFDPAS